MKQITIELDDAHYKRSHYKRYYTEEEYAKQAEKDTIFQKAKETGEKQIIETYSVECSDPDESCDLDIVTVYAMPDGTTKTTQNHTW